jgi:hypothetical protein
VIVLEVSIVQVDKEGSNTVEEDKARDQEVSESGANLKFLGLFFFCFWNFLGLDICCIRNYRNFCVV